MSYVHAHQTGSEFQWGESTYFFIWKPVEFTTYSTPWLTHTVFKTNTTPGVNIRTVWSSYLCLNVPYIYAQSGMRYTPLMESVELFQ